MIFLVTDDELLQLNELVSILQQIRPDATVFSHTWPDDALETAKLYPIDVRFLYKGIIIKHNENRANLH